MPARNEALLIGAALQALVQQRDVRCVYEVIVLANNCSDQTAARARAVAPTGPACAIHVVEVAWPAAIAHVGRARRALMDCAALRLQASRAADGLIISTDADTRVEADWLAANVSAIDAGAAAVGGRITAAAPAELPLPAQRLMRLDDAYRRWHARLESLVDPDPADPWPRHHQHFGASLAVTASAYRAVADHPLVPFLEDVALVDALRLQDLPLRHAPDVRVYTSARLDGRAEVGLAWQLRSWAGQPDGACPSVPDPHDDVTGWMQRRVARQAWHRTGRASGALTPDGLAAALNTDAQWLDQRWHQASTFGAFWRDVQHEQTRVLEPVVPMDQALRQLRRLLQAQRGQGSALLALAAPAT